MTTNEEPSYMMFARANVRDFVDTPPRVVHELLARIDKLEAQQKQQRVRVQAVSDDLLKRGEAIAEKGNNGSIYATRAEGRGIGYREAARAIHEALKP